MITLLTVAGIVTVLTAVYAVATKAEQVELFANETTLSDAEIAAETMATGRHLATTPPPVQTDWQLATVNALSDAEELLDTLENQGYAERELVVLGDSCFAIRWR
jgi:hypothetical protein